ncbi:MAG TPA: type II toxin-antitoxin system HicA family toxin [Nitrososphaerales archaeon]|nr:type II toxin-antitoxin system HicA family toxin [Nitrososphaerales archaeon]
MSWRDVLKALAKGGFRPVRQRGSHVIVEDAEGHFVTVPKKDEIKRGTLLSILEEAGLTRKEFLELVD